MRAAAAKLIADVRARVLDHYGLVIGRPVEEVPTPALILDLPAATRNIAAMAAEMAALPGELRPHIKVHKSPDLMRIQLEYGVLGATVATVWEAAVMAATGVDDILVANTVTGPVQLEFLARLASEHRVLIAIDDPANAVAVARAAAQVGAELGVLVEVDTGMDRAGVDTEEQALSLVRTIAELPELRFEGLSGYEGHCSGVVDDAQRAERHRTAMEFFAQVAQRITDDGIAVPIRSAGGTSTWRWTANFPGITEIQAGSYVVMDNFHGRMVKDFEFAVSVAATVISRPPDRVVIDAGNKTIAVPHLASLQGVDIPNLRFDEEHGVFGAGLAAPVLGARVRVVPGYAPTTINNFEAYHVVADGEVVDIWPVVPRGPGHHGLARALSE
jgi:D-serine deaminase-like pyridoxal phosphate-dependent protein